MTTLDSIGAADVCHAQIRIVKRRPQENAWQYRSHQSKAVAPENYCQGQSGVAIGHGNY